MKRERLTQHQAGVLADLRKLSARKPDGWVRHSEIGAAGACQKLVDKGYAEKRVALGARGGQHPWYRPL